MGSKSPSTPDIRQLPANTGTNTIANNQSMIQRGFPVITDGNNNITSGLRRNDGSLVPIQGTPFKGETFNQVPEQYREGFAEFMRNNPKYRIGGQAISYATLPDGNQIQFGDTGGASGFREYLKTLNTPNGTGTQMPIGGTPLPEGVQIGYGPIRGGYFYGDGTPYNPPGSLGTLGGRRPISSSNFSGEKIIPTMEQYGAMVKLAPGVSLQEAYNNAFGPLAIQSPDSTAGIMSGLPQVPTPPGFPLGGGFPPGGAGPRIPIQPGNLGGAMIPEQGPLGPGLVGGTAPSTGIDLPGNLGTPMGPGELINPIKNTAPIQTPTEVPQPMNPVTGNTSPIGGSQQDFDAYMNSYVNDLINQRMKNVFGGIMSSFS